MERYYILTRRKGLRVIEASTVDEFPPGMVRFVTGSGTELFNREELLWWSPVLASPPAPYSSSFDSYVEPERPAFGTPIPSMAHGRHSPQHSMLPQSPWEGHHSSINPLQRRADFSELSVAAETALIAAMLPAVPRDWKKAMLELKVIYVVRPGRYKISHRIRNPDTGAEAADFSDGLFAAVDVFHRIHVEGGQNWNECILTLRLDVGGQWRPHVKYNYGMNFGPR